MNTETIEIRQQLLQNIRNNILKTKNVAKSYINIYPDVKFSSNKILKVELFLDLNKLYRQYSERPSLFDNLSIANKKEILDLNNFTICLYKQRVRTDPTSHRSSMTIVPNTRKLVEKRKLTTTSDLYRVFAKDTSVAGFVFNDVLESTLHGTQIMYSYEVEFVDKMPFMMMRLKREIELMISQVAKSMNALNAPASGFLKDPIKGRDTGTLNPYTGKFRLPKHYGGPINSEGFYSSDFISSKRARILNTNIHSLLALYMDAMEFVSGEKRFAYSVLLKDKSIKKVERNLSILKDRIFDTLSDTYKVKPTSSPKYLRMLLKECKTLASRMGKMCGDRTLSDGSLVNNSLNRKIKFNNKFNTSVVTVEDEKMYLPIIYTRLHHQQDLDIKYETLSTLRAHRSHNATQDTEEINFNKPISDLPSPIFGLKRCYNIHTGKLDSHLHLQNLKRIHQNQHGDSVTIVSSTQQLQQGMSMSSIVGSPSGGGY